eukprot:jgi/Chlat1/1918/Chrsp152S02235
MCGSVAQATQLALLSLQPGSRVLSTSVDGEIGLREFLCRSSVVAVIVDNGLAATLTETSIAVPELGFDQGRWKAPYSTPHVAYIARRLRDYPGDIPRPRLQGKWRWLTDWDGLQNPHNSLSQTASQQKLTPGVAEEVERGARRSPRPEPARLARLAPCQRRHRRRRPCTSPPFAERLRRHWHFIQGGNKSVGRCLATATACASGRDLEPFSAEGWLQQPSITAFPRHRRTATSCCANLSNGGRPNEGMRDPANASESAQSKEPPTSPLPLTPQTGLTINIIEDEDQEELQEYELRFLDAANFDRWYFVNDVKALFKDGESPGISDYDALEDGATYYLHASRGDNIGHVVRSEREPQLLTRREAEFAEAVVRIFSQRLGAQVVPRPDMRVITSGVVVLAQVAFVGECGEDLIVGGLESHVSDAVVVEDLARVAHGFKDLCGNRDVHIAFLGESVEELAWAAMQTTCRQHHVLLLQRIGEDIEALF